MQPANEEIHIVTRNRKARHEYEIVDTFEAGIELRGSEVKSIREGKVSLNEAYAAVQNGQVVLLNMHINPYKMASHLELDPLRPRRLLLHKKEIRKLYARTEQKGLTLVPLSIYFKGKHAKIELGLGIGRKKYDKREAIAEAEAKRRMTRATQRNLKRPE
jgi:SsrA-binding protein